MFWSTKITRKSFKAFTTRGYKTFPLYVVAVIKRWCYRHMTMSLLVFKKFHILCVKARTPSHWSISNIPPSTTHSQTFIKRSRFWSDPLWNQLRYSPGPEGECWQLHGDEVFSLWVFFWSSTIAESLSQRLCAPSQFIRVALECNTKSEVFVLSARGSGHILSSAQTSSQVAQRGRPGCD